MRIFFKILLFPISLVLTVFVAICSFLIEKCAFILNIISGILFLLALSALLSYLFGWPFGTAGNTYQLQTAIIGGVIAFLLSPYGLPNVLAWFVEKLDDLNDAIKSI